MLLMLFLGTPIVSIPALFIIYVILKNEKLQTKNNAFLINLLVSDIILVFSNLIVKSTLIIMHLFGMNIGVNCVFMRLLNLVTGLGNKMCFVPVVVDRLLYIALPFSYKKIMTNKMVIITVSVLWLVTVSFRCLNS